MLAEAAGDPETTLNDVHHMISVYPSSKMHLGMKIESMLKDSDSGCQVTNIFESGQIFVHKEVKVGMILSSIQDKRYGIYDPFSKISKI